MEPLIHFVVPLTLLTILGVKFRRALPLSLLALLPDLDVFFHVHRSFSHSILIFLAVFLLTLPLAWRFKSYKHAALALLMLISHPILDLFSGYTPVL